MNAVETVNQSKEILSKLGSSNIDVVSQALDEIKINGTCDHIFPMLDILLTHPGEKIETKIFGILADIRDSKAVTVIMEALFKEDYKPFRSGIVSACWQSNLDFSGYLSDFVEMAINEDYMTAFEALTVIDNIKENVSDEIKGEQILQLKSATLTAQTEKQLLLTEIIHLLNN